jgi:hypothetical protein
MYLNSLYSVNILSLFVSLPLCLDGQYSPLSLKNGALSPNLLSAENEANRLPLFRIDV